MKFKELLTEAKAYTKKGRMYVLKEPIALGELYILALGKDLYGNPLIRVEDANGKKKSFQTSYEILITIDDVISGLSDKETKSLLKTYEAL